jgi:uncharacterized protein YjbJ (UPF0337 family)
MSNSTELQAKGHWNDLKGKLKQKFASLTDDDLLFDEGQEDQFWGKLQVKLGKTKQEIKDFIDKV